MTKTSFHLATAARARRLAAVVAVSASAAFATAPSAHAANDLIIGAHEAGSTFYTYGAALADLVSKHTDKTGKLVTAAGAAVWMPMMENREVDVGVISHYEAWLGANGKDPFPKPYDVRLMLIGGGINVGLYVREDSPIGSFDDLAGKRIGGQYAGAPAIHVYAQAEIANAGLEWTDMEVSPRASLYAGQREDVSEQRLDVFYASVGSGITTELDSTIGIRFLGLDESPEAIARMREVYPVVVAKVPAGPPGIKRDILMTYLPVYAIAHAGVDEDTVYQTVKAVWEHNEEFRSANAKLKGWTIDRFVSPDAIVPYHEGAIRFFKEKGVWTDEMQKRQDQLLAQAK
jgi:TRAP transporter TAXI family solute receptor